MRTNKKYLELAAAYSGKTRFDFLIKRITTLKVGGSADALVEADTNEKLTEVLRLIRRLDLPYFVIAGGSNLLFSDKGFRGVVVHYTADNIKLGRGTVKVDAGCSLVKLVRYLANKNFGGLDFLANIPGSVGGGVVGNAGCYGKGIGEYVAAVTIFNMKTSGVEELSPKQLEFSYRNSLCKAKPEWVVTRVKLKVISAKKKEILKAIEAERMERWQKHPQQPSAGSFFKNPPGQAAWKFIDAAGLRGKKIGGARISAKHPNFIINDGGAKAADVVRLMQLVQKKVLQQSKIRLEPEVRQVSELGVGV